jgi:hypothetical protein
VLAQNGARDINNQRQVGGPIAVGHLLPSMLGIPASSSAAAGR